MGPENMKPGVMYFRDEHGTWNELGKVVEIETSIKMDGVTLEKDESDLLQFNQPDWSASLELKDPKFPFALLRRIFGFWGAVRICFNRWRFHRKFEKRKKANNPVVIGKVTAVEHSDGGLHFTVKRRNSNDCKF